MRALIFMALLGSALCACSPSDREAGPGDLSSSSPIADKPAAPPHRYLSAEGDGAYMYSGALSDEDRYQGKAANSVIGVRYMGFLDGVYRFRDVDNQFAGFYCKGDCSIITMEAYGQVVQRIQYDPSSVAGAAIDDARNGYLKLYDQGYGSISQAKAASAEAATHLTPAQIEQERKSLDAQKPSLSDEAKTALDRFGDLKLECFSNAGQACSDYRKMFDRFLADGYCASTDAKAYSEQLAKECEADK